MRYSNSVPQTEPVSRAGRIRQKVDSTSYLVEIGTGLPEVGRYSGASDLTVGELVHAQWHPELRHWVIKAKGENAYPIGLCEATTEPSLSYLTDDASGSAVFSLNNRDVITIDNDNNMMAWRWDGSAGFGPKIDWLPVTTWGNSTPVRASVNPVSGHVAVGGTGNGANAIRVWAYTEGVGFGANTAATLDGANGDEVNGVAFHPDGNTLAHWGILTAVGQHDFNTSTGALSNFTSWAGTFGATQRYMLWHKDGGHLAVFNNGTGTPAHLGIWKYASGTLGAAITMPSFSPGTTLRGAGWSPNGKRLAASWGSGLFIFDFEASTDTLTVAYSDSILASGLVWLNNSWIAYRPTATGSGKLSLSEIGPSSTIQTLISDTTYSYQMFLEVDPSLNWVVTSKPTAPYTQGICVSGLGLSALLDIDAGALLYTPDTPGDWDTVPTTVDEALDELAARVRVLEVQDITPSPVSITASPVAGSFRNVQYVTPSPVSLTISAVAPTFSGGA